MCHHLKLFLNNNNNNKEEVEEEQEEISHGQTMHPEKKNINK